MATKTITGAHISVHINNRPFGRLWSLVFKKETPREFQFVLDEVEPVEIKSKTSSVTGELKLYRTSGDAGAEGAGIASRPEDLPNEKYFNITLIDRRNDTTIFEAKYCSVVSQEWIIKAKELITGSIIFYALTSSNELRPRFS